MPNKTIKPNTKPTRKIMICDDEEGVRESLKLILGEFYELIVVDSPQNCLETLKHAPDVGLVFLDIKMPKVNGLEVLDHIHNDFPHVKVAMVTGYRSVDTAAEASKLGASGYIVKPFNSKEILETAKKWINK